MHVRVGDVIPFEKVASIGDRQEFMNYLREETYKLGEGITLPKKKGEKRPRTAPKP
jgi:hypothetical protein